ncbi:MAG TPA: cytochrome c biogenesis protein CcdA [Solirubrobacteraceae bacterium]|nr:cytochrome c biogenesis protein CcdA [Solirubrobacteraceae bacterium]
MSAAATFAFGAGLLATVNPCGFAMLPGFLSLYLGSADTAERPALARGAQGFRVGLALTGGFAGAFVIAGLILSIGLRWFVHVIPWVAVAIAAALVLVGIAMLLGRHVGLTAASRVRVDGRSVEGYCRVVLFGASYAVASLSCTLAVFLIVVGQAVAAADPIRLLAVFGAYAAGSATVLVALSLSVALAKAVVARAVRWLAPVVSRLAGALLAASGVYLVIYWLPTLRGESSSTPGVVTFTERLSATLETFLSAHIGLFVGVFAALLALGCILLLGSGNRRSREARAESVKVCVAQRPKSAGHTPASELVLGGRSVSGHRRYDVRGHRLPAREADVPELLAHAGAPKTIGEAQDALAGPRRASGRPHRGRNGG